MSNPGFGDHWEQTSHGMTLMCCCSDSGLWQCHWASPTCVQNSHRIGIVSGLYRLRCLRHFFSKRALSPLQSVSMLAICVSRCEILSGMSTEIFIGCNASLWFSGCDSRREAASHRKDLWGAADPVPRTTSRLTETDSNLRPNSVLYRLHNDNF